MWHTMRQSTPTEMNVEFYTEDLIRLVKERPALWNQDAEEYRDKNVKIGAWDEICSILNEKYHELDKRTKADYRRSVVCKWTNVRDCWKKCLKKRNERRPGGKLPRPYIYHRQLSFLMENDMKLTSTGKFEEVFYNDENSVSAEGFATEDEETSGNTQDINSMFKEETTTVQSARKRKLDERNSPQTTTFDCQTNQKEEENRHMLFFQSLLPSLTSLDDDQTIRFQIEVLTLVHKFRKQRNGVSN